MPIGFEPMQSGFADRPLRPLGYSTVKSNTTIPKTFLFFNTQESVFKMCYNRPMNRSINVFIDGKTLRVPLNSTVAEALDKAGYELNCNYEDNPVVGATVNGELKALGSFIETENTVIEPVKVFEYYGRRIYRHTLSFVLFMAAEKVFSDYSLSIKHSMGNSLFFSFDDHKVTQKDVEKLSEKMNEIVEQNLEIQCIYLSSTDAVKYFADSKLKQAATLIQNYNNSSVQLYKADDYIDISYEPLAPRTVLLSVWKLELYEDKGILLRYPDSKNLTKTVAKQTVPALFKIFEEDKQWGKVLGVSSLGEMNNKVTDGSVFEHIRHCETLHRRKIYNLTDDIKTKKAKAVFISGPSSSGKTTFAKKICEQLSLMGLDPIRISLDDYYKPRTEIPKNEKNEIDYECIEALRVDLFKKNMEDLFNGKEINLPEWSISEQKQTFRKKSSKMTKDTIFVIEGIHALNPVFTSCVPQESLYRIYISALTQLTLDTHNRISTTDIRIIRRIVRDSRTRGIDATTTLAMKSSIGAGESKHIFPFQSNADTMFNSSLDYEIGVLSTYASPLLAEVLPENKTAYTEARRLLAFLKYVNPIPSDKVPSDSILREFIGNGDYED